MSAPLFFPMSNTPNSPSSHRAAFILTVWEHETAWRGCLERADGKRFYFKSLTELQAFVQTVGWIEAGGEMEDAETYTSSTKRGPISAPTLRQAQDATLPVN